MSIHTNGTLLAVLSFFVVIYLAVVTNIYNNQMHLNKDEWTCEDSKVTLVKDGDLVKYKSECVLWRKK